MCYTCGCGKSEDAHGNSANITDEDFRAAAEAVGESDQDAMRNALNLLKDKLSEE